MWLRLYRRGGFEALKPKPRKDAGDSRALPQEVKDLLVSIKEDNAELSVQLVIKEAVASKKVPEHVMLAPTTVHRLLSRAGLMRKDVDDGAASGDRRRNSLREGGRALAERRDARPGGDGGRAAEEEDVPHRLHRLLRVGQAELRRSIGVAVHAALSQRIVVRYHLDGLARDELPGYLTHLLHLAGTELPLFEASAVETLFQATSGLLRKVNLLAHHSLSATALAKAKAATAEHVQAAMAEVS